MPCDCSGYPAEITAFGKTYAGSTTNYGDTINYRQAIEDGEHALCRAQQVIRDLVHHMESIVVDRKTVETKLWKRVLVELQLLEAHEAREQAKLDAEAAKQREYDEAEQKQLREEKKVLERRLKDLEDKLK